MTEKVKIIIPGTLPNLNDYISAERTHRQAGAKMKRLAETRIKLVTRPQLKGKRFTGPVIMRYTWYEPNRRRDKDNISSFGRKVIQDALVQDLVLPNDGWENIISFSDCFAVDKKNPRVEVEVEQV